MIYIHAILACDGVSVFRIVYKGHIDSDEGRPVCREHLAPDYGHQTVERKQKSTRLT